MESGQQYEWQRDIKMISVGRQYSAKRLIAGRLIPLFLMMLLSSTILFAQRGADTAKIPVEDVPGLVRVTRIRFDHDNSDAIHLRKNYSTPIPKPEWMKDQRSEAALFVQNSPVEILVRFEAPETLDSAFIWAEGGPPLGGVAGHWVSFTDGISDPEYCSFSTETPLPEGLGLHTWNWQWRMYTLPGGRVKNINVSGPHEIYTILGEPGLPWETQVESTQNPWTDALDLVLGEVSPSTIVEALDEVTAYCFDRPCFEYDIWSGSACYISYGWNFNLTLFIQDMVDQHDPRVGNCYDGAAIVHTLADLLGAQTHFVLSNPFGYLNCIDPIGREEDFSNNPFHANASYRGDPIVYQDGTYASCSRSSFGNHAFAATQPGPFGVLWDATMCVDVDDNCDTSVKFPPDGGYRSTGLTATTLTDSTQNWDIDQWAGMYLNPNTNELTPEPYLEYTIVGNTETVITVTDSSNMTAHADSGDYYWIRDPGDPEVNIIRLDGYHWTIYEAMTVDAGNAAVPSEISIGLY